MLDQLNFVYFNGHALRGVHVAGGRWNDAVSYDDMRDSNRQEVIVTRGEHPRETTEYMLTPRFVQVPDS